MITLGDSRISDKVWQQMGSKLAWCTLWTAP